jgi:hypothetical protein
MHGGDNSPPAETADQFDWLASWAAICLQPDFPTKYVIAVLPVTVGALRLILVMVVLI